MQGSVVLHNCESDFYWLLWNFRILSTCALVGDFPLILFKEVVGISNVCTEAAI